MIDETQDSNNFLSWAKQVSTKHPDILEYMKNSTDLLDRVIAKRIIQVVGVG